MRRSLLERYEDFTRRMAERIAARVDAFFQNRRIRSERQDWPLGAEAWPSRVPVRATARASRRR